MSIATNVSAAAPEAQSDYGARLSTLERRVEILESAQPKLPRSWPPPPELIEQIKQITRELFSGEVQAEVEFDPSEPDDPWVGFDVWSDLDSPRLKVLRRQWHQRVEALGVSDATRFRLGIARP